MKQSIVIILLAFASTIMFVKSQDIGQDPKPDSPVEIMSVDKEASDLRWHKFKSTFNKVYPDSETEAKKRKIFEETVESVNQHNVKYNQLLKCGKNKTKQCLEFDVERIDEFESTSGLNHMSDLTNEEFENRALGLKIPNDVKTQN